MRILLVKLRLLSPCPAIISNSKPEQPSVSPAVSSQPISNPVVVGVGGEIDSSDQAATQEDDMEEEAPDTAQLTLGNLGGFGLGSSPNPSAPKQNPFGAPFGNPPANTPITSFAASPPSGGLFKPASFSIESQQPSQPQQQTSFGAFAGGFASNNNQSAGGQGFGQPAKIGSGQQALGSVLGSFGQSRQFGAGLPGSVASPSPFGSGFASNQSGGFATASGGSGFANLASGGGGFSSLATSGGGFAGAATGGGGFGAPAMGGGGFGAPATGAGGGFGGAPAEVDSSAAAWKNDLPVKSNIQLTCGLTVDVEVEIHGRFKEWKEHFFLIDRRALPMAMPWRLIILARSQTSSHGTGKEYQSTRITYYSGQKIRPNFCINKLAPSVGPAPRITLKRMSAMANTTPLVTTVTKPATNPRDADATPRVNIQDLCEEYYEDILPIIMDKVRRDKQKEVHARLDFEEGSKERRTREDSHHSSARARTTKPERLKVQDRVRHGDRHVFDRLGHQRQSAFDQISETYLPSTTKSKPRGTDSRDHPRGRSCPHRLDTSNEDCSEDKECFRGVGESYDDSYSHFYRDENRSRHMKRRRDNESPLSSVSKSDSSDGRYQKSRSKRHKPTDEDDLIKPWMCEEEDPFTPQIREMVGMPTWCHMFNSTLIGAARVWFDELPPESVDSYKDLKAAFLAYFTQQKKYVKDPMEIHNIKQKDEETIEDSMERFKVETGRMKGPPECMQIFGFMHGVNNPELTKCLNEHVPKTMEEMMITTTAFIREEAAAASKKKGH
nr:nuclear pore complex protein NUP214 isoform X2 [Tanacetum cinerariifolium]